jgi:hypothetical protein
MAKPPLCGDPGPCLRRSKRCSFDCAISRRFKSGKTVRDLLLQEDEIDERSLTLHQRKILTENHEKWSIRGS